MVDIDKIALQAEVIVSGFAMLDDGDFIKVVNLNNGEGVAVFKRDGTLIETNMDSIELSIARESMFSSLAYMED